MKEKERKRKTRNLLMVFVLTAIIITVSTYAWFIGMRTVNVSSFDVSIATTDSLLLSTDGEHWSTEIDINGKNWDDISYAGHQNTWGGAGLTPISSVGVMNVAASRLELYEKASLTAVPGGFRLMASKVPNDKVDTSTLSQIVNEPSGYVAFDLFIKNFSGRQYITKYDPLAEEAIYLTNANEDDTEHADSMVTVSQAGVANTGIENSVRVAFAQIGRVIGSETSVPKMASISCNNGATDAVNGVTGICRTAAIWEPNDTKHTANAISWYNKSCAGRLSSGTDVTNSSSYSGLCQTVEDSKPYPTYAINSPIASNHNVNVYDGYYNGYSGSTRLTNFPYFTDTMKDKTSVDRQEIFTLAPNSITKVRVYIWIEGQDIDNYDFASIGKSISVAFGFTKERFTSSDTGYNGPDLTDETKDSKPVILYNGTTPPTPFETNISVSATGSFNLMEGITAIDEIVPGTIDDLTRKVIVEGTVDRTTPGTYTLRYLVSDWWGNYADSVVRKVIVS